MQGLPIPVNEHPGDEWLAADREHLGSTRMGLLQGLSYTLYYVETRDGSSRVMKGTGE
jgi:hypothetical protein